MSLIKQLIEMSETRTLEERVTMVRLFSKHENLHEVQRQCKHYLNTSLPALTTITSVNQRFKETESVADLPRTGRPATVLIEEKLEEIQHMVDSYPRLSIRQGFGQAGISKSRYHSAMQKLQLKFYHPTLIVDLNEDDFDRRSQFCEMCPKKFNNNSHLVDHILWSDECKFNRNGTVNRHNCTYRSTENPHVKFTEPNTEEGMMVWCGLSSNGFVGPLLFQRNSFGFVM